MSAGGKGAGIEATEEILESFTVLHVPPEGFPSPPILGFVLIDSKRPVLASAVFLRKYRLGERVKLEREGNS